MENSGFFDAKLQGNTYDRVYYAETFAKYFSKFIGNGVFVNTDSSSLLVTPSDEGNMKISIRSGYAWINGYWYENDGELCKTLDVADGVFGRIDLIVLRYDIESREIRVIVKKGSPTSTPAEPTYNDSTDYVELVLAKISIPAGTTKIQESNIVDTRLLKPYCGVVAALVDQIDTTSYGNQLNGYISRFMTKAESEYTQMKDATNQWVHEIEDILTGADSAEITAKIVNLARLTRSYTYTVDSNQSFEDWVNNVSGNDYRRVLIKDGTYTIDDKCLNLGKLGTEAVVGEGNATLVFNNGDGEHVYAIIGRNNVNKPSQYYIENISVIYNIPNDNESHSVFYACEDLRHVRAEINSSGTTSIIASCFNNCFRLVDCIGVVLFNGSKGCGTPFASCYGVTNCGAHITGGSTTNAGYYECRNVSSCTFEGANGIKFKKCTDGSGNNMSIVLEGTLTAGKTKITFTDTAILKSSTYDIYTSIYGVSPKSVVVSNGSMTMTFKAQSSNVNVKVVVK